jgi:dinuclear metal center YbgI/SA1388 family protein
MTTVGDIADWMNQVAPLRLSEAWDNTGLLLGDRATPVSRVMTCLTLTDHSVDEAVREKAQLVIAHHPLPFKALNRITTETVVGRLLWKLASAGIAIYSPHTAWDSAANGINAQLAQILDLQRVEAVIPAAVKELGDLGAGRMGELSEAVGISKLAERLSSLIPDCRPRGVDCGGEIKRVAISCGSGGSLLAAAAEHSCDLFLTGEATFHNCLEAEALGISLLMIGHFASERFALVRLAQILETSQPNISAWASIFEKDPVRNFSIPASI